MDSGGGSPEGSGVFSFSVFGCPGERFRQNKVQKRTVNSVDRQKGGKQMTDRRDDLPCEVRSSLGETE